MIWIEQQRGKERGAAADSNYQEKEPNEPALEINFPETENRCPTLSLQQFKPAQNPWKTGESPIETGYSDPKPAHSSSTPSAPLNEKPKNHPPANEMEDFSH